MLKLLFLVAFIFPTLYSQASAAEVQVVVNKSNTSVLNEAGILKILKAESLTWANGNSVVLLIDDIETTDPQAFDEVMNISKSQFMEFWRIKFFSGRALIPKQITNAVHALTILSENKNVIYISIGKALAKEITDSPHLRIVNLKY
jgi:hypothetical protein